MSNLFDKLKKLEQDLNDQIAQAKKSFKEEFTPAMRAWMAEHPKVEAIRWRQYTPYFNDGDACYFRMSDIYFKAADPEDLDDPDNEGDYGDEFVYAWDFKEKDEALYSDLQELEEFLIESEDILESVLGDHATVTITADQVKVERYNHD